MATADVPVLKQGEFLIASLHPAVTDETLVRLQRSLVDSVGRLRSPGVVIDVTAVDVLDSFATRTIRDIASMVKLRGAETVMVGIQPEVAFTMVQLGLSLEGVTTALDLEDGIACLAKRSRGRPRHGRTAEG